MTVDDQHKHVWKPAAHIDCCHYFMWKLLPAVRPARQEMAVSLSPTQRTLRATFRDDLLSPTERLVTSFLRFATKIAVDPESGCWNWTGARDRHGYGRWGTPGGRTVFTHRLAYEVSEKGPIPPGLGIDHLCRNTSCCNPDHLEPVTQAENVRRGMRWRR